MSNANAPLSRTGRQFQLIVRRTTPGLKVPWTRLLFHSWLLLAPLHFANGQEILSPAEGVNPAYAEIIEEGAIHQVNHLSNRRRLTTFFANEQTPFYGVQLNYVNVGRGNLTFLNRDLVRLGRIPIVIGRVYDSRPTAAGDFGMGWKLSVAELIRVEGSNLTYIDSSGSEYLLSMDGNRIRSPYPHLTGITRGRRIDSTVELDVGSLRKRFKQIGDALYLDEVRNGEGDYLQLEYQGTRISRVVSNLGRFVRLHRNSEGQVVQIEDDVDRSVNYQYDDAGRLVAVSDVAGRSWRLTYDANGLLSGIVDPRGSQALEAAHDEHGRTRTVRVLYDSMSFDYDVSSTTVRNAHQQSATFWQDSLGLTTAAQDFAGSVTQLTLSDELRPVGLTFDGGLVARFEYSDIGKLKAVTNFLGSAPTVTQLGYDDAGRITKILEADELVAKYEYDERGRPLYVSDHAGQRSYQYSGRSIQRLTVGESELEVQANGAGLLTGFRNDSQAVRLLYDDRDELQRIRYTSGDQTSETEFEYDASGLRTNGTYVSGDKTATLAFGYDEVGNLKELISEGEEGQQGGQTYILGDKNQLLAVRNNANARPDLSFDYDLAGRPIAARFGDQIVEHRYDNLGRLSAVYRNGAQVLQSNYGPMDPDVATEADGEAAHITIDAPTASAIFGSLEAIAYDRTHGTPYGPVRFSATMGRFIVAKTLVPAPDTIELASFQRRALPVFAGTHEHYGSEEIGAEVASPLPMGFDKPSNGLFLPAEFSSLNCYYCIAYVVGSTSGIYLRAAGTSSGVLTVPTGTYVGFEGSVNGASPQCLVDIPSGTSYGYFAELIYTDGWAIGGYPFGTSIVGVYGAHAYAAPGLYTAELDIGCGCSGFGEVFVAQVQRNVQVVPPPQPTSATVTTQAGVIGYIDKNLNMPTVQFTASVTPSSIPVAYTTFHWYLEMAYTEHGKNFVHRVPSTGTVDITGSNTWQPSWGGLLAGGNAITAYVSATANGGTSPTSGKGGFEIHGENPTQAQLFAQANFIEARAVMWQESTHRQFNAVRYSGIALPLWGAPDGWGLMQRDPLQSEAQLWNWQNALSVGISYLNAVHADAQAYMNFWYTDAANNGNPADDWSWNPASQFPDRVWDDGFSRYNTGSTIYTPNGNQGNTNCAANSAGCSYANAVRGWINNPPW